MTNDDTLVLNGEMSRVLSLMKKTFYSNKEIFLRKLIKNAFDVTCLSKFDFIFVHLFFRTIIDKYMSM